MADYRLESQVKEINRAAARIARKAADDYSTPDKPRFVAGSIGPTNKSCSMSPDMENPALRNLDFDTLATAYLLLRTNSSNLPREFRHGRLP